MIRQLSKRIGVRLALWYTAVFIASLLVLYATAFGLLKTYLSSQDKDFVHSRIAEFQSRFQHGGFDAMMDEVRLEIKTPGMESVFIRVADRENNRIFSNSELMTSYVASSLEPPARLREDKWTRLSKLNDEDALDVFTVRLPDGKILQVGKTSVARNEPLERFLSLTFIVAVPVIALGLLGGFFLSSYILLPIRNLISTVKAVTATGQFGNRVPVRGTADELDELGLLFNRMLDKIELLVGGMKDALDNVAHDLRTPMTRLRNTAEAALESDRKTDEYKNALADCLEQSDQALTMLKTLMDISEAETGTLKLTLEKMALAEVLGSVIDLYSAVAEEKSVGLAMTCDESLTLRADRSRIRQAMANLVDNALKYTPTGGSVRIEAERRNGGVQIVVKDTGVGIPASELPRIWDRLYRGDQSRAEPGLGLGLSLVQAIIHAHQGTIHVESRPGAGSVFTAYLPQ